VNRKVLSLVESLVQTTTATVFYSGADPWSTVHRVHATTSLAASGCCEYIY